MAKPKKRSDGRYMQQIYIGKKDGKRQYKTFSGTSQKEVTAQALAFRQALGRGLDVEQAGATFKTLAENYKAKKKAEGVGNSWLRSIQNHIDHMRPIWDMPAEKVRAAHVQQVLNDLAEGGEVPPLAKKTLGQILGTCRRIFDDAIPEVLPYNPCTKVVVPAGKPSETREAITEEQRRWVEETPHRAQRAAMLMLYSGLRRGEATALTWADIDFDEGTISVTKAMDFAAGRLKAPKTEAGRRVVEIPQKLVDFLRAEKEGESCIYVLHDQFGNPLTATMWRVMWQSYMADLNIKYGYGGEASKYNPQGTPLKIDTFTPHQLRHTFCTLMYKADVDVLTAKEQMGHRDVKTTLAIYTHMDKCFKKKSMKKLDNYLCKRNASGKNEEMTV